MSISPIRMLRWGMERDNDHSPGRARGRLPGIIQPYP